MIGSHHTAETNSTVRLHGSEHVGLSVVMERLDEVGRAAANVAKVDEVDLTLLSEMVNPFDDIDSHRGDRSLAKSEPMRWAGMEIECTLERLRRDENARDAPE